MGKSSPTEVCCSGSTWRPLALAVVSGLNVAPRRRRVHGSAQPHFLAAERANGLFMIVTLAALASKSLRVLLVVLCDLLAKEKESKREADELSQADHAVAQARGPQPTYLEVHG
ncbi:hypothetical protein AK812_SmicGene34263 [Symbiodinium microadriaticum]|uniref:Uncharacterized protein n=1 Tax=Symbiodinium microadriaticum TaxID=2951 RepID=A0A1Q9CPH8_SYMMI|nr:hypothetical protein AK812_SmicGene34263 [Symbiodinium microadriaticum]